MAIINTSNKNLDIKFILEKLKAKTSSNGWVACCPAHEDTHPSLSLTITSNGKLLWKCFAGCSQMEVFEALNKLGVFERKKYERN